MTAATAPISEAGTETRTRDIQVFSSPSDAPRTRWRTDLVTAAGCAALLIVLGIVAGDGSRLDDDLLRFIRTLPGWLLWLAQAAYFVGMIYVVGLTVGVGLFARRRLELLRDIVLAGSIAVLVVLVVTQVLDDRWPELAFVDLHETRDTFPTFSIAAAVAIQSAASPHLTTPFRHVGSALIGGAALASLVGGVAPLSDMVGGVLVGLLAAALVRFALGTSAGIPSTGRVRRGLADLGVEMDQLEYVPEQSGVSVSLTGTTAIGASRFVSVLGSDAWRSRRLARWWREAWYQDVGIQSGSDRRQQVEHEALAMVLAARDGASVPALDAVGVTIQGDAMIVTSLGDHRLADVDPGEVDDEMLASIWACILGLHAAGLSHGAVDARHVWFDATGAVRLAGFAEAAINSSDVQRRSDLAATLVLTTSLVGAGRAITAARTALGDDELAATLPVLQPAALGPGLRARVRHDNLKIRDLRARAAAGLGIDAPEPRQLTRVTWMNALMAMFIGLAAYTIVAALADVGFDTIADTLSDARWGLVLLGLALTQATNYTDAVALSKVSPKPVPVGVTTIEQFAIGFVNVAVPSAAGRIATNARFFERFGISPVTSTACGVITSFLGFTAQVILIVVTIAVGAGSIDLSNLQGGGGALRALAVAAAVAVAALIVVVAVPKLRHWVLDQLRSALAHIGEAFAMIKDPSVATPALGAAMGTEILYGAGLATCVLAMGGSISLGEAVFINVAVSLFAGVVPIPGGVGVTEAAMTAGLTGVGVPSDTAVGAVLVFRLVGYYLPPLWGYVSLRWLTRHDYL